MPGRCQRCNRRLREHKVDLVNSCPPPRYRLRSSYYNSPVTVDIKYCREVEPSVYEREVEISVFGRVFCIAKSLVVSHLM